MVTYETRGETEPKRRSRLGSIKREAPLEASIKRQGAAGGVIKAAIYGAKTRQTRIGIHQNRYNKAGKAYHGTNN